MRASVGECVQPVKGPGAQRAPAWSGCPLVADRHPCTARVERGGEIGFAQKVLEVVVVPAPPFPTDTLCVAKQPPTASFGSTASRYFGYQSLSASLNTKSNGPASAGTRTCASPRRESMNVETPAWAKFASACVRRLSSMSMVMSLPPVLLSAHAIQMPECPVDVPISSARVYLCVTMMS